MTDDYLYDKRGEPDPEVERLERLLAGYRYEPGPAAGLPSSAPPPRAPRRFQTLAIAAGVLVAAGLAILVHQIVNRSEGDRPSWEVVRVDGRPLVGDVALEGSGRLGVGDWLETDERSRANLSVATVGHLDVEPDSRLRIRETRPREHRIELARGKIQATINAPPRIFIVDTPSASAVDLGCKYTLEVDKNGASLLQVTFGYVALERDGRESFVPKGAACETRPGKGVGTPCFTDADAGLRNALFSFDFEDGGAVALNLVLAAAHLTRDTLPLWNLLPRVGPEDRGRIYDTMAGISDPPSGVSREAVLRLDRNALEAWKEDLRRRWL